MENKEIKELEKLVEKLEDVLSIRIRKQKTGLSEDELVLNKRIEDGLFNNIKNTNDYQIEFLLNKFAFRYYFEYNENRNLVKERIRNDKLKTLEV